MKKAIMILIALGITAIDCFAGSITYTASFNNNDFSFQLENGYNLISHPKCTRYGVVGAPQVLSACFNFIIPVNEAVTSVQILYCDTVQFPGIYMLFPTQTDEYYVQNDTVAPPWVGPDSQYYFSGNAYPDSIVKFDRMGFFDGANHIASIMVFPVFFRGTDSLLFYHSSITFVVNTGGLSGETPIYVQTRMRNNQRPYDKILKNIVSNPQDIPLYGYTPPLTDSAVIQDNPQYPVYPFLIVTRDSLLSYWQPFVDWLNRKGYRTRLISIENIVGYNMVDNPTIADNADLLRGYLKYAYQHGTVWVILGGVSEPKEHADINTDYVNVPLRYMINPNYQGLPFGYMAPDQNFLRDDNQYGWHPAEIYFSELNLNWDTDGDGHPGEWASGIQGDNIVSLGSPLQELFLARVPVVNGLDITRWTQKILNYEQNPGNGDYSYLLIAYWDVADQFQLANEEVYNQQSFHDTPFSFQVDRELPDWNDPNTIYPHSSNVIQDMSSYPALPSLHHHGSWGSGKVRCCDPISGSSYIVANLSTPCPNGDGPCSMDDLTNIYKPGFLYSVACGQSGFDYAYRFPYRDRCLACNYILTTNGGIGAVGMSRFSWIGSNADSRGYDYFLDYIFNHVVDPPDFPDYAVGPALAYVNTVWCLDKSVIERTYFGSPETEIWSAIPSRFTIIPDYPNDQVRVMNNGNPVEEALVCFASRDLSKYYETLSGTDGYAQVTNYNFDVTSADDITITKHNFIPYQIIGSGDIDNNIYWRGDIVFYGNVTVPSGKTLTIKPGAIVKTAGTELSVRGTLKIEGTSDQYAVFTSVNTTPAKGDWTGIRVYSGGSLNMSYCDIQYATTGIRADQPTAFAVDHCLIDSNSTAGIYVDASGTTGLGGEISHSRIQNSGNYGVYWKANTFSAIYDTIYNTSYGIYYLGNSSPNIEDCVITRTAGTLGSYYGIYMSKISTAIGPLIKNDSICGFSQGGIYFYGTSSSGSINNTDVVSCGTYGIYYSKSNATIGGAGFVNLIKGNTYGLYMTNLCSPAVRRTKFWENISRGVFNDVGCHANFGSLTPSDYGENSFKRTGAPAAYYDLYNSDATYVDAYWCYWGEVNPLPGQMRNVNYNPYFNYDRLPRLASPEQEQNHADDFALSSIYPNPFNPSATIAFNLTSPQQVSVRVYNIMGQAVATVFDGIGRAGENTFVWDGRNLTGQQVAAGVYFCHLRTAESQQTLKMTVLK